MEINSIIKVLCVIILLGISACATTVSSNGDVITVQDLNLILETK
jgi:hypothetical protein